MAQRYRTECDAALVPQHDGVAVLYEDYHRLAENCMKIQERAIARANEAEARTFAAWRALRQQQKGMNRMARKIKRLQAALRAAHTSSGDSNA